MSTLQLAFIGMVIVGMVLFLAVLAWGCWYTRTPTKARKPAPAMPAMNVTQATRPA